MLDTATPLAGLPSLSKRSLVDRTEDHKEQLSQEAQELVEEANLNGASGTAMEMLLMLKSFDYVPHGEYGHQKLNEEDVRKYDLDFSDYELN